MFSRFSEAVTTRVSSVEPVVGARWAVGSLFLSVVLVLGLASAGHGPRVAEVAIAAETATAAAPGSAAAASEPVADAVAGTPSRAPAGPDHAAVIPVGKGMWLNKYSDAMGGDPHKIIEVAKAAGLTHLYVRVGSSRMGFYGGPTLESILPVAHANGIKVVGWDFPYLDDPWADAERGRQAIEYTTRTGDRMDAFSADIETKAEGTNLTTLGVTLYGNKLRELAGMHYPLIATVPRPSPKRWFPFKEATEQFDAIAPMVYWVNRDPGTDVANAIADLRGLGKPILPVGQAYDPALDGSPVAGPPSGAQISQFVSTSAAHGAVGVSFWVWNTATQEQWLAISAARQFVLDMSTADGSDPETVQFLQRVLSGLGHATPTDGVLGDQTKAALAALQQQWGLPVTGRLDGPTFASLLKPRP